MKNTKALLEFWEEQMRHSHRSSNYFFRKSPFPHPISKTTKAQELQKIIQNMKDGI